jgi:hypothetical protein
MNRKTLALMLRAVPRQCLMVQPGLPANPPPDPHVPTYASQHVKFIDDPNSHVGCGDGGYDLYDY